MAQLLSRTLQLAHLGYQVLATHPLVAKGFLLIQAGNHLLQEDGNDLKLE